MNIKNMVSRENRLIVMKYFAVFFVVFIAIFSFVGVQTSYAQGTTTQTLTGGIVKCDGVVTKCGWQELVTLINDAITYILWFMVPMAAIVFAYAGFLLLTKGDSPQAQEHAKGIFINVVIGVIVALASFLIIKTILDALGVTDGWRIFTK